MGAMSGNSQDGMKNGKAPSNKTTSLPRPPRSASPQPAAAPPAGQERETLLARTLLEKNTPSRRFRSGSYGSKGDVPAPASAGNVPSPPSRRESLSASPIDSINSSSSHINQDGGISSFRKPRVAMPKVATPLLKKSSASVSSGGGEKGAAVVKEERTGRSTANDGTTLVMAFVVMIFVGTGNRIFMKLQTYPMYNYPFFLTMLSTFIYVPVCFAYILPMLAFGSAITPEQRAIPKFKFAVMGMLDSVAGIMSVFAVNYINNAAMIVLLQQAAIPISMSISRFFLGARYSISQYIGATIVIAGIIVTLIPTFFGHPTGGGDAADAATQVMWSGVQVMSCIPMCLSSVYKEKALGDDDMDVIYLNGWVAVFQFLSSLFFAVPSAYAMGLPIYELPLNTYQGYECFMGRNSQMLNMAAGMRSIPADHCETAPFFVSIYLCFNLVYNVVMIVILKYGSANVLFLASTVMVPIGNVAFSLNFVPHHQDLKPSDTAGLFFILTGLVVYRFSTPLLAFLRGRAEESSSEQETENQTNKKMSKFVGINQLEYLEPLMQTRLSRAQKARLQRSPQQIRSSFMHRLGLPPSPLVSANPSSRVTSPYILGRSTPQGAGNPRASPGGYRASPGGYRASPGAYRASPGSYRASPGAHRPSGGYHPITDASRTFMPSSVGGSIGRKSLLGNNRLDIAEDQA